MRVHEFDTNVTDGFIRYEATATWEDSPRDPLRLFYTVPQRFDGDDAPALNPMAFVIPCAVAADRHGERRLVTDAPVCPDLCWGIQDVLGWLHRWSPRHRRPLQMEVSTDCAHPFTPAARHGAAFFSGGVDSLALLVANLRTFPEGHPRRIRTCIAVAGIQRHRWGGDETGSEAHDKAAAELAALCGDAGTELLTVQTNVRQLDPDVDFWQYEFQGAALAGVAHILVPRVTDIGIASTWDIPHLGAWGSHPAIDPSYGSHLLNIRHDLAWMGRLDKTRLIATWPQALKSLHVCNRATDPSTNCGDCEKCVRTMLALEALGILADVPTFRADTVTLTDVANVHLYTAALEGEYRELLQPLRERGRSDLAHAVQRRILVSRLRRARSCGAGRWRQPARAARPGMSVKNTQSWWCPGGAVRPRCTSKRSSTDPTDPLEHRSTP